MILHCFWAPTFDYGLYKTSVFCVPASPILPRIPIQISANGTNPRRFGFTRFSGIAYTVCIPLYPLKNCT